MGHEVMTINAVHHVFKKNRLLGLIYIFSYIFYFRVQKRTICKFRRTLRKVKDWKVFENCFIHDQNLFSFDKCWALSFDRRELLVRSFIIVCLGWYLEESGSCWCWEWFLKNDNLRPEIRCFTLFLLSHTPLVWWNFLFQALTNVFPYIAIPFLPCS